MLILPLFSSNHEHHRHMLNLMSFIFSNLQGGDVYCLGVVKSDNVNIIGRKSSDAINISY